MFAGVTKCMCSLGGRRVPAVPCCSWLFLVVSFQGPLVDAPAGLAAKTPTIIVEAEAVVASAFMGVAMLQ